MEYFGWLTKGKCEISILDIIILFSELGFLFLIGMLGYNLIQLIKRLRG